MQFLSLEFFRINLSVFAYLGLFSRSRKHRHKATKGKGRINCKLRSKRCVRLASEKKKNPVLGRIRFHVANEYSASQFIQP